MSSDSIEKEIGISREGLVVKGTRAVPLVLLGLTMLTFFAVAIQWTNFEGVGSALFTTEDFEDLDGLVKRLTKPEEEDHISKFVWDQFSTESQLTIRSKLTPRQISEEVLVKELNEILESDYSIYSAQLFPSDLSNYDIKIITGNKFPRDGKSLIVAQLAALEDDLMQFRIFDAEGKRIHYNELDISNRYGERSEIKELLKSANSSEEDKIDKARLIQEVTSNLGYTGLGATIDREKKQLAELGGDHTLLNRLLLEHAFPEEIYKTAELHQSGFLHVLSVESGRIFQALTQAIVSDVPAFINSQLRTAGVLSLFAFFPGLAGLIYRRAFWKWFLISFATLFIANWVFFTFGWGEVGADLKNNLHLPYQFYLWTEALVIFLLLVFRLRRHSAVFVHPRTRRNKIILAIVLILFSIGWYYSFPELSMRQIGGSLILLVIALVILSQTLNSVSKHGSNKRKNIVVCFDGTWNQPGQKDFGHLAETNVFKLFKMLKGNNSHDKHNASRCKEYIDQKDSKQIAFYYHGVGNKIENSQLGQLFGGAFGMGADAIVERAYLDVARVYQPGDRIFIFGFSRGAAISRLFAGAIGRRGVPNVMWTLRLLGRHWLVSKSSLKTDDVPVEVLGCWDTVGSFGISKDLFGIPFQKINLLKDLSISLCVKRAYHMVALDETRDSFEPTLMDPDPITPNRIIEVWFSGSHCNVGGGYATDKLSDLTLDFLLKHISSGYAWQDDAPQQLGDESWGLYLKVKKRSESQEDESDANAAEVVTIHPNPRGRLRESSGAPYTFAPRKLPIHAVIFDSVFDRMRDVLPVYAPQSLFNLNVELVEKRGEIETEVNRLLETGSLTETERQDILNWSNEKLSLTKWSKYLEHEVTTGSNEKTSLASTLNPAEELKNPPTLYARN